ncbi:dUTPase-like protein [Syncephalis fuscata]|nr:dUTPase-like protein [Syncephalis fuscata]
MKIHDVFHVSLSKKYEENPPKFVDRYPLSPPPEIIYGEEEYEKGYAVHDAERQQLHDLDNAQELVQEFEKQHQSSSNVVADALSRPPLVASGIRKGYVAMGGNDEETTKRAAGYDLYAAETVELPPRKRREVNTDIAMEIPKGIYKRIASRSGLAAKHRINVLAGVIDTDYRDCNNRKRNIVNKNRACFLLRVCCYGH